MANIRLGLIGSTGRMGTALRSYLPSQPDIELAVTLDSSGELAAFLATGPDVVVDLSTGPAVDRHAEQIVGAGLPYIIGATGYQPATLDRLRAVADKRTAAAMEHAAGFQSASLAQARATAAGPAVLIVPNFSLGASLMILAAARAARLMHSPTVIERHHQGKADAPSGTALFTARRIAAAREAATVQDRPSSAAEFHEQAAGALGTALDGVAVHALRGAGYLADQEVSFCLPGETLRIEHRSIDRQCFMPGVVYAIRHIGRVRGVQIGLDTILEDV